MSEDSLSRYDKNIPSGSSEPLKPAFENELKNESLTTELQFELLKQYVWLSSAGIGAIIALIQLKLIPIDKLYILSVVCFLISIINSFLGQDQLVDALLQGKTIFSIKKRLVIVKVISFFFWGMGLGVFVGNTVF